MIDAPVVLSIRCEQRVYPPYDPIHATPDAMLWRRVIIETPQGEAEFEQTDYGHPGRLNVWMSRGVAPALLPKLAQLQALVSSIEALL